MQELFNLRFDFATYPCVTALSLHATQKVKDIAYLLKKPYPYFRILNKHLTIYITNKSLFIESYG